MGRIELGTANMETDEGNGSGYMAVNDASVVGAMGHYSAFKL